jgi:hypothetical protein
MSRLRGAHHVDRDVPEFLQELRVAQTGGQVYFAFLFSVAFLPAFAELSDGQRVLYAWNLLVIAMSSAVLVAPVAIHQWNFGRGLRPAWLVMTHVLALVGLALLGIGVTLGMTLVSTVISPGGPLWLPVATATTLVACWLILPLIVRIKGANWPVSDHVGTNDLRLPER